MKAIRQAAAPVFAAAVVIWLAAVLAAYYAVHKPFTLENVRALASAAGDVAVVAVLVGLAMTVGHRLLRRRILHSPFESWVLEAGLGLGVLSFATLALGLGGLLNPLFLWGLVALVLVLLRRDAREVLAAIRALRFQFETREEHVLACFCAFVMAAGMLLALTPVVGWDSLQYHLVVPQQALAQGRIMAPPDNPNLSYPALVEMLYLLAMALKGDTAAQLVHWTFLALTAGALAALARRYANQKTGWLAVAILLAVPSLIGTAATAYVDLALTFYATAAFLSLARALERDAPHEIVLAGVFAGMAVGCKYTGIGVPLALGLVLVYNRRDVVRRGLALFLACAVVALPWFLRNWAFTSNPIYPFLFGGTYWDTFRAQWFGQAGAGLWRDPLALVRAPWDAVILGREGAAGYEATTGPLLLALLPLLLAAVVNRSLLPERSAWRTAFVYACGLYAFWLVGIGATPQLQQTRFLYPAFPVLALLAAGAVDRLDSFNLPAFSIARFTRWSILLVLGLTALGYGLSLAAQNPLAYLTGAETREAFLSAHLGGYYEMAQYVNSSLPASARVLFLYEPRSYYLKRTVQPDVLLDALPHLIYLAHDADGMAARLAAEGYTHVLVSRDGLDYVLQTSNDAAQARQAETLVKLLADHGRLAHGEPLEIEAGRVRNAGPSSYALYALDARGQ